MTEITDITWSMMTKAGIDIDLVKRQPTSLGTDEYILVSGDTKVAFGPAVDTLDGGTFGWDISRYELVNDGDDDEAYWDQVGQNWAETPDEALRLVADSVADR